MGRRKITIEGNTISGTAEDLTAAFQKASDKLKEKEVHIKSALLKDDFCNYTYEQKSGVTAGDGCKREGSNIVHDDLKEAFKKLNVHLAFIDDAFINAGHHVNDIEEWNESEITEKNLKE